ncbi:MAG: carboxylating nicotinate-nucleotide diphosphorylase [Clostridiales Family XIII bacterium]|jgi:nicotinate-nucleotide pyrophosphorylase (carboxylating)|nr:carboxylating nicotinate-nucleotide diphosphorylase [Clostridiales Family XIII bacterium]
MDNIILKLNMDDLILQALKEDISGGDVTTASIYSEYAKASAELLCKEDGIIAGLDVWARTFELLDPEIQVIYHDVKDGDRVSNGQKIATVTGDIRVILSGERVGLNYLQRMSGIATYTRGIVNLLEGSKTKLLDTRKTTPNMRIFEKYAVRIGGGTNHRYNLSDGVLLKDNHIAAAGGIQIAVEKAKAYAPFVRKIEVEVESLEMLREALDAGADIIMLDNMSDADMAAAVSIATGKAELEVSGNVTADNIKRLIGLGVDYISSGALTHSAPILDLSLKNIKMW